MWKTEREEGLMMGRYCSVGRKWRGSMRIYLYIFKHETTSWVPHWTGRGLLLKPGGGSELIKWVWHGCQKLGT